MLTAAVITIATINWPTVFAAMTVVGTIIYNVAKTKTDNKALDASALHNQVSNLTTLYKELVDDLHAEVLALREENKHLTVLVQTLTTKVEDFEKSDRALERANKALTKEVKDLHKRLGAEDDRQIAGRQRKSDGLDRENDKANRANKRANDAQ